MNSKLVLENGEVFYGESFGAPINEKISEVVFNTSMTGYQEVLSDPSYCDQIVTLSFPLIGNYGINKDDYESLNPALSALIVKDLCEEPSHWKSIKSLDECLKDFKIPGISKIDTRKLTRIIAKEGNLKGAIVPSSIDTEIILNKIKNSSLNRDQVSRVSTQKSQHFPGTGKRVILIDYGYKKNILYSLMKRNCDVIVVPFQTSFEEIKTYQPDGIILSNSPGDPIDLPSICFDTIKKLQELFPLFGICLGHQLFALTNGAKTYKLKFGHRGSNHPVKVFATDRTFMSSQNHGYAVNKESISSTDLVITQSNLNDDSIEGLKHRQYKAFSVQYHPEANPGPYDTQWLFDDFMKLMEKNHA